MEEPRSRAPAGDAAALLTPPHNYAVVQLPDRVYPGVVVQGDSLYMLWQSAQEVAEVAKGTPAEEDALYLSEELHSILRLYMRVLGQKKIPLPFNYIPPASCGEAGADGR